METYLKNENEIEKKKQKIFYNFFFSTMPSIHLNDFLQWTWKSTTTYVVLKFIDFDWKVNEDKLTKINFILYLYVVLIKITFWLCKVVRKYTLSAISESTSTIVLNFLQDPPNKFFFGKCLKKNCWIFSQISFFIWKYNPSA